jgi:fructose-1,6-bisphosphatase/inositol monophosphatase family enzyme
MELGARQGDPSTDPSAGERSRREAMNKNRKRLRLNRETLRIQTFHSGAPGLAYVAGGGITIGPISDCCTDSIAPQSVCEMCGGSGMTGCGGNSNIEACSNGFDPNCGSGNCISVPPRCP